MIEFVTLQNLHCFSGNPIAEQHRLRFRSIIVRQGWNVPEYNQMEFDQYDNPATKYLVWRDDAGIARGVSRLYPSSLPYMLEEKFSNFVTTSAVPKDPKVWEGSRFCIDETLPVDLRRRIIQEIVIGYLEVGLTFNLLAIVGLMYPAYWRSIFIGSGWDIKFMGDILRLEDGNKARAAWLPISAEILAHVRAKTGIQKSVINFGVNDVSQQVAA